MELEFSRLLVGITPNGREFHEQQETQALYGREEGPDRAAAFGRQCDINLMAIFTDSRIAQLSEVDATASRKQTAKLAEV